MIAPFANRVENAQRRNGETYPDFFEHKIDLEKIKPLIKKIVVVHSKDDTSIPFEQGIEIACDLGAELISYENRDHFSEPKNAKEILHVLSEKLRFKKIF